MNLLSTINKALMTDNGNFKKGVRAKIAKLAGVSGDTVYNILRQRNTDPVSMKTRKAVLDAAEIVVAEMKTLDGRLK